MSLLSDRRQPRGLIVGYLPVLAAMLVGPVAATAADAPTAEDATVGDAAAIAKFAGLPVRFNGRLTTIETAAAVFLRRISGRETFFDDRERAHSAAEWYLREAGGGPELRDVRIVKIDHPELSALLKLEPRPAPGPNQHRYAFDELVPAFAALAAAEQKVGDMPASEFTEALGRLGSSLRAYGSIRLSFREPAGSDVEQLQQAIADVQQLDSLDIPLVVPPKDDAGDWTSWGRGVLENAIIDVLKDAARAPNPAVPPLREVFAAYRAGDASRFAAAVDAYAAHLKSHPPRPAAFDFETPRGWHELGVPVVSQGTFYDDTLTSGAEVARFVSNSADGSFDARVMYFPGPTASIERIVNHWRINSSLAPLDDAGVRKSLSSVRLGSLDAASVELSDAAVLAQPPRSLRAVVLRRPQDALVVLAEGSPAAFEAEREHVAKFLRGLTLGAPEAAAGWFGIVPAEPRNPAGLSLLIVTARIGGEMWMFRASGFGPLTESGRAEILKFVAEFPASRFLKGGDRKGWSPPAGWRLMADGGEPAEFQRGEGSEARYLAARPLVGYTATSEAPLVDHWRTFCGLPSWTNDELAANVQSERVGTLDVRYVELVVPAAP